MAQAETQEKKGFSRKIQAFGSFLSSMIMPNIGAFIAWGFIAAIFIDNGWFPNKQLSQLAGPMITYLIPLLIAFSGGRLIHGLRGGIIAATSTMGVIVALPDTPMLLGAMIMGPLVGWLMKKIDEIIQPRTPQGFEMLFNNFSAGILGFILSFELLAPLMKFIMHILSVAVEFLVHLHLLPIVSIIVEPAKIVFLNNAINHGVFTPLGADQVTHAGQSILFTIESNPGPGLGILLAYMLFGKGTAKATSYGAGIIHFLGGIHEIYFPYVLMRPLLFLAVILGGMTGVATYQATGFGFKSPASPGSFIVYCLNAPRGEFLHMLLGVVLATLVSFIVAALIMKFTKEPKQDLEAATAQMESTKGKKSNVSTKLTGETTGSGAANTTTQSSTKEDQSESNESSEEQLLDNYNTEDVNAHDYSEINHVIFACDAGMGSSAMGASMLRNKFKKAGLTDINVTNTAINQLPSDAQLVITQKTLTDRAIKKTPNAIHISVDNFLNSPRYEELLNSLKKDQNKD